MNKIILCLNFLTKIGLISSFPTRNELGKEIINLDSLLSTDKSIKKDWLLLQPPNSEQQKLIATQEINFELVREPVKFSEPHSLPREFVHQEAQSITISEPKSSDVEDSVVLSGFRKPDWIYKESNLYSNQNQFQSRISSDVPGSSLQAKISSPAAYPSYSQYQVFAAPNLRALEQPENELTQGCASKGGVDSPSKNHKDDGFPASDSSNSGAKQFEGEVLFKPRKRKLKYSIYEPRKKRGETCLLEKFEKNFFQLIALDDISLWVNLVKIYKSHVENSDNLIEKQGLRIAEKIEMQLNTHDENYFYVKNEELNNFISYRKGKLFEFVNKQYELTCCIEPGERVHGGFDSNLRFNIENADFENLISKKFEKKGKEEFESFKWRGRIDRRIESVPRLNYFFGKMFLTYSMLINKIFCEEPGEESFIERQRTATGFYNRISKDIDIYSPNTLHLNVENFPPIPPNPKFTAKDRQKIIKNFNHRLRVEEYQSSRNLMEMTWSIIHLWLAHHRVDLYKNFKVEKALKPNIRHILNFFLLLLINFNP
ncbi:expressed protein [Phakopsora pachyrhizi]|uniref:Expressed protein n=1 Tax=Phakopsora pachyrhizi TaxID=170000 RepID=A0AAV0AWK7_PHAPC|nr:expressed protein [Phakopsora pachyrhizi]